MVMSKKLAMMAHFLSMIAVDLLGSSHMNATSLSFGLRTAYYMQDLYIKRRSHIGSAKLLRFNEYYSTN
jgi:hypothetical protein